MITKTITMQQVRRAAKDTVQNFSHI